jgi:hypothetical protein
MGSLAWVLQRIHFAMAVLGELKGFIAIALNVLVPHTEIHSESPLLFELVLQSIW